jgi:hypothetical protein
MRAQTIGFAGDCQARVQYEIYRLHIAPLYDQTVVYIGVAGPPFHMEPEEKARLLAPCHPSV